MHLGGQKIPARQKNQTKNAGLFTQMQVLTWRTHKTWISENEFGAAPAACMHESLAKAPIGSTRVTCPIHVSAALQHAP